MVRHAALKTFDTKGDAEAWLIAERTLIAADAWTPPKLRRELAEARKPATFSAYATVCLEDRDLKPRTRSHYQALLDNQLKTWDPLPINDIPPEMVRDQHAHLNKKHTTTRAHAFGLLRTILATAVPPHLIPMLRDRLSKNITGGKEGLLFPAAHGGTLAPSTLYKSFYPARDKAGRPDLRWHDLRHRGPFWLLSHQKSASHLSASTWVLGRRHRARVAVFGGCWEV